MNGTVEIRVGLGSCGVASGGEPVCDALLAGAEEVGARDVVKRVGCNGMCHLEPMVEVIDRDQRACLYANVTPDMARAIAARHVGRSSELRRTPPRRAKLQLRRTSDGRPARCRYLAKQRRIVLENCGEIDPRSIDEYLARDGYRALRQCVTSLSPDDVVAAVTQSGLRGRGGAGFPTGTKWAIARRQPAAQGKYVICNGDEGDPGAFMDRLVLESRSASRRRGARDRGVCHRRHRGHASTSAPSTRSPSRAFARRSRRPRSGGFSASGGLRHGARAAFRGAGGRRRVRVRRGDRADPLARRQARHAPAAPAVSG